MKNQSQNNRYPNRDSNEFLLRAILEHNHHTSLFSTKDTCIKELKLLQLLLNATLQTTFEWKRARYAENTH